MLELAAFFIVKTPFLNDINIFNIFSNNIELAKAISMVILALAFIGWRPRYTCILHWWVVWSFATKAIVQDGGDQISQVLTMLLIPICLTDSRRWHWEKERTPTKDFEKHFSIIAWFAMILIALQISVLYFQAATAKFNVEEWANGTSMFYWIQNPIFGISKQLSDLLMPLFANAIIVTITTYGALLLEILLFMAIAMKPSQQSVLMWMGIAFHLAILILFGLVSFFFAMSAALILYLGPKKGFRLNWKMPQALKTWHTPIPLIRD